MPTCKHCGAKLSKDGRMWVDLTGGDVCPVNETVTYDKENPSRIVEITNGDHEPEIKSSK